MPNELCKLPPDPFRQPTLTEAEAAGVLARRAGYLDDPPHPAGPLRDAWLRGYRAQQARIEAEAEAMRDAAATVDVWGFV